MDFTYGFEIYFFKLLSVCISLYSDLEGGVASWIESVTVNQSKFILVGAGGSLRERRGKGL